MAHDSAVWPPARAGSVQRNPSLALTPVALPALAESARCEVTLLFADLFGFSAFAEERDLEQVAAVVGAIKQEATRIVHVHGGIVNQFVGDEIMALFGFPKGKEDAPRRAIEAALVLHDFVRSSDLRHWLGPERQLYLHSGIDAGVVLVRTRDVRNGLFELTGAAVNRAARLRSVAGRDELLVSHRVHARVAAFFQTEQLYEQRFKGIAESSTPHRILARRDAVAAVDRAVPSTAFARSELAQLQHIWQERRSHRARLVVVQGAAGSGKTRLLEAFGAKLAHEGVTVLSVRGRDDDCQPFSALARLWSPRAPAAAVHAHHTSEALSALGLALPSQAEGACEPHAYAAFIEAATELLAARVEAAGSVHAFLIDDVQWLDSSSRAVLRQLGDRLLAQGHMYVCAARDDDAGREALERLGSAVPVEQRAAIQLGPLNADDTSGLVAEYLGLQHLHGPEIIEQLTLLSDGTPLGLCELLELLLENKYLQPREGAWRLETEPLRRMQRSASARALVERRIAPLDPDAVRVLRAAAIMRGRIDVALLPSVTQLDSERVHTALDDASLARLIELDAHGTYRFAHDTIWEVLLSGMTAEEQRERHQCVAHAMRESPSSDPAYAFELARHCAAGMLDEDPAGSFEALQVAARLALAACDDALALTFLRPAAEVAQNLAFDVGARFYAELGETSLRVGEVEAAYAWFEASCDRIPPGFERAHMLGRMAWIRHFQGDGAKPLQMLEEALRQCGRTLPRASAQALAVSAGGGVWRSLRAGEVDAPKQRQAEILCGLYTQVSRVFFENGQPLLGLAAGLQLSAARRELPAGRARVKADAMVAFYLLLLGARARSHALFETALASARTLADPIAIAYCHQLGHVLAGWRGDLQASEQHARESVIARGQYMELGELCNTCIGMYAIETYCGRNETALQWLEQGIGRVQHAGHAPAMFSILEEAACCLLASQGRHAEILAMKRRLRFVRRAELGGGGGTYYQISFQQRIQHIVEQSEPDQELDALVAEFGRQGLSAKRVHLAVVVYYVQVAHARVHQCLRAEPTRRSQLLPKLAHAMADVEASTRLPLMHAHMEVLRAAHAWFSGEGLECEPRLCRAEEIARVEGIPWVSYAAARLRAHMLRAAGKPEAALDQARIAALYARQYAQHNHLRFIRDEFQLEGA